MEKCQTELSLKDDRPYLIFGGTGSLGKTLIERLLKQKKVVVVFSRDEAKHHNLKLKFPEVKCIIGDVRDYDSVFQAIRSVSPKYIINAAAMKQVPICEEYPYEAVLTNTVGTHNIVKAVYAYYYGWHHLPTHIVSISTDKACKPVNSYGMTKALQERIHLKGNISNHMVHNCVRYGNVLESTGSVIPVFKQLFQDKIKQGFREGSCCVDGPWLTITDERMTRFLLSLDEAVDLIFKALEDLEGGKIFIPKVKSSKITDLADAMIRHYGNAHKKITGIRPGEKLHEILISEEELMRTEDLGDTFVIHDINSNKQFTQVIEEYNSSSPQCLMDSQQTYDFLKGHGVL